jgi:hypothetical protein
MMWHIETQLPLLSGSALKVCVGGVGSTQLCGHPNFVLGWSWVVTKIGKQGSNYV